VRPNHLLEKTNMTYTDQPAFSKFKKSVLIIGIIGTVFATSSLRDHIALDKYVDFYIVDYILITLILTITGTILFIRLLDDKWNNKIKRNQCMTFQLIKLKRILKLRD
jgi:hypothetical protein